MSRFLGALCALFLGVALASCGGGGGGGGDSGPAYAVTFSPSTARANIVAGTSASVTVSARATDTSLFASGVLYVFVVDSAGVLTGHLSLSTVDNATVAATFYTSPSLAEGRYQGTLQVRLCADAQCARQYPRSPVPLPYDFTVVPAPLSAMPATTTAMTVHQGGSITSSTVVNVGGPRLAWTASTSANWLTLQNATGTGPGAFTVGYSTSGLALGQHSGRVTVRASDGQTVELPFTVDVLPVEFTLTSGVPAFAAVNGAPIAAQNLSFDLNNHVPAPWTASTAATWMQLSALSGATPATIALQPEPSRSLLASGVHSADVVLSSPGVPNRTVTSQLSLTRATLSAPNTVLTLGGLTGRDMVTPQQVALSLNTGAQAWPWSLSTLPAWLSASQASGQVNQSGASVSFQPNIAGVTAGSLSSTVTFTSSINGDTVTLPVTVNLNADQRRLLVSDWGVGFSDTPNGQVLSRTLTVRDNFAGALPWTAVSNVPWLTVTASGNTGVPSTATLVADPASLPSEAMSYATVTLSSSAAGVEPAIVRVGLWKSASGRVSATTVPVRYTNLVADKIRPYVYAHGGSTSIDVYHVYTGALVDTIQVGSSTLARMAVSADGARLYVVELNNPAIAVIDLDTRTRTGTWVLPVRPEQALPLLSFRPNGVEIVLVSGIRAFTASGRDLGVPGIYGGLLAATADGRRVYAQDTIGAPTQFWSYDVDYSAISGGILMVRARPSVMSTDGGSYGRDIAVSPDGTRLYVGAAPPYECARLDTETLRFVDQGMPGVTPVYLNNIEVASDGRVLCGSREIGVANRIEVHAADGSLLQTLVYPVSAFQLLNGQMVVSPDGRVVVALSDSPNTIGFLPIAP